ncbi:unnamed protein product [Protopolystoma xenopodis]|uniref:Secreted protein n=1 Tax=Protopolystoma xenopodis TaxID=117903 RepID=A0A3S5BBJ6_9PLAT|nr:unnamed protein product [Protopolystoma xenopodis]
MSMASRILPLLLLSPYAASLFCRFPLDFMSRTCDMFRYFGSFSVHASAESFVFLNSFINRVNDSFRIRSSSKMSSSRSNISSKALSVFSPEMFMYMDCTSKLTDSSVPTSPMF